MGSAAALHTKAAEERGRGVGAGLVRGEGKMRVRGSDSSVSRGGRKRGGPVSR
jgi:hypothetical protein